MTGCNQAETEAGGGKECAQHERIAKPLGADFYFAHPYASWERGANENMNGLIRQFFPKKMTFDDITDNDITRYKPRPPLAKRADNEANQAW